MTLLVGLLVWAAPTWAQDTTDATDAKVDAAIERQKKAFGPPSPRKSCGVADGTGEIVVCAPDNSEHRVQSSAQVDPTSHAALYDGLPRAPQLDRGSCKGEAGCVSFGWAPPPIYYIDLKAIPEAPPGSDADLIAKGEKAER